MTAAKLIFLIGMPAAGKTYWGEKISRAHGLPFIDLDVYISHKEQASVPHIFAHSGEGTFREKEHVHLLDIIQATDGPAIVACGGGTPCFHSNMELMKATGIVIYLQADVDTLVSNLQKSAEIRPLLQVDDLNSRLHSMLAHRQPFYEQAHHILPVKDISIDTFAKIIRPCINRH